MNFREYVIEKEMRFNIGMHDFVDIDKSDDPAYPIVASLDGYEAESYLFKAEKDAKRFFNDVKKLKVPFYTYNKGTGKFELLMDIKSITKVLNKYNAKPTKDLIEFVKEMKKVKTKRKGV